MANCKLKIEKYAAVLIIFNWGSVFEVQRQLLFSGGTLLL